MVAPLALIPIWVIYSDIGERLDDATIARDVARQIADGERALLDLRLVSHGSKAEKQLVIATDRQVVAVRGVRGERWGRMWAIPYTEASAS